MTRSEQKKPRGENSDKDSENAIHNYPRFDDIPAILPPPPSKTRNEELTVPHAAIREADALDKSADAAYHLTN